jgi:hypothetical protein
MTNSEMLEQIEDALERRAEFWQLQKSDPHNINTAVRVALLEVKEAIEKVRHELGANGQ